MTILTAVTDGAQNPVNQAGPDGRPHPVLRVAPPSALCDRIRAAARTTFMRQAIRLDRYARQFMRTAPGTPYRF